MINQQAKVTVGKIWSVEGLRGMTYEDFDSVITQLLDKPDISQQVAFLEIGEVYNVGDLAGSHARTLLYQKLNTTLNRR